MATNSLSDARNRPTSYLADDTQLLAGLVAQDQSALRALVSKHQTRVFRFIARTVRSEAAAEELTNEVFLDAWRGAARFEGR